MTGLVRKATLFTACGVFVAAAAMAGVPSPGNSTIPAFVTIVGQSLGVADPSGAFTITVRDLGNNPINGSSVLLDFSTAVDLRPAADQLDAGSLVNCTGKTVRRFTDVTGQVSFTVVGGSNNLGASPGAGFGGVKVYADGVLLGALTAAVLDQDFDSGAGANDLSVWLSDQGSTLYFGRSDYDYDSSLGANDLSLWLGAQGTGLSAESGLICP